MEEGETHRLDFVETMAGCVDPETRAPDATPVSQAELKADWVTDLP